MRRVIGSVYRASTPGLPDLAVVFVDDQLQICIKIRDGKDGEDLVRRLIKDEIEDPDA